MEDFGDALLRKVSVMNPNVSPESVRNVVKSGQLSWVTVEDQKKEFVVEILREIEDLDESQCNELFDKMDGMVPIEIESEEARRNCALSIKSIFYEKWIMKCMYSVSEYFPF